MRIINTSQSTITNLFDPVEKENEHVQNFLKKKGHPYLRLVGVIKYLNFDF